MRKPKTGKDKYGMSYISTAHYKATYLETSKQVILADKRDATRVVAVPDPKGIVWSTFCTCDTRKAFNELVKVAMEAIFKNG